MDTTTTITADTLEKLRRDENFERIPNRRDGGPDRRGGTRDRKRRKAWLMSTFGDGRSVPCRWCGKRLTRSVLEVDRHPLPGWAGGSYKRGNIVPACAPCNRGRR